MPNITGSDGSAARLRVALSFGIAFRKKLDGRDGSARLQIVRINESSADAHKHAAGLRLRYRLPLSFEAFDMKLNGLVDQA